MLKTYRKYADPKDFEKQKYTIMELLNAFHVMREFYIIKYLDLNLCTLGDTLGWGLFKSYTLYLGRYKEPSVKMSNSLVPSYLVALYTNVILPSAAL